MFDTKKIDSDILEEIMALCEKAMIQPLSKKKPDAIVHVEEEELPIDDHEKGLGLGDEMPQDEEHESPDDGDISDDDVDAMMEEYKQRKGR